MCYPVCGMVHIKEPLLLIGKSSLCGGSRFSLSLYVARPLSFKLLGYASLETRAQFYKSIVTFTMDKKTHKNRECFYRTSRIQWPKAHYH